LFYDFLCIQLDFFSNLTRLSIILEFFGFHSDSNLGEFINIWQEISQ
jgi:hypothetical protein